MNPSDLIDVELQPLAEHIIAELREQVRAAQEELKKEQWLRRHQLTKIYRNRAMRGKDVASRFPHQREERV